MGCNGCNGCAGKKPMLRLAATDKYEELSRFFEENGLENTAPEDETVPTESVKAWAITAVDCGETEDAIVGAVSLGLRQREYIIDGIAVAERFRAEDFGSMLVAKAVEEVKHRGGNRIYLVARAPKFFEKNGFRAVSADEAPEFFECFKCPQYGKGCKPEIMKLDIA